MTNSVKNFIERNIDLIEQGKFTDLLQKTYYAYPMNNDEVYELRQVLHDSNVWPWSESLRAAEHNFLTGFQYALDNNRVTQLDSVIDFLYGENRSVPHVFGLLPVNIFHLLEVFADKLHLTVSIDQAKTDASIIYGGH